MKATFSPGMRRRDAMHPTTLVLRGANASVPRGVLTPADHIHFAAHRKWTRFMLRGSATHRTTL